MKKILITGANSYIGTSVEKWLSRYPDEYLVDTIDMKTEEWKKKDFSTYDVVFHVAGIAHVSSDPNMEDLYYKVNRDLTIETAKKAKSEGVKQFIFMSSIIIYGDSSKDLKVIDKNTIPQPSNFYGNSKLQAEQGIILMTDENFKVVVLRPPMIYGKGSKGNYPRLAKVAIKLPVFPDIDNQRSMLHIDNLCEFIKLIIDNEESGVFFPQNKEYVKTSEMVRLIAEAHGKKIKLVKIFNPILKLSGKRSALINKVFGNLVYNKKMSDYNKLKYQIRTLDESIKLTENKEEEMYNQNEDMIIRDYLVSIITPAYNCSAYIEECIESVLNQTYQNWEMIIVNDKSTDHTQSIIERYVEKDKRIVLFNQEKNMGVAAARNKALELSKGRFVAFLDSDDAWKPNKLERQLDFMIKNNYGFTFTSYEIISDKPEGKKKIFQVPQEINYNQYLKNTIIGNLTVIMDKELLGDIQIEVGCLEDVLTWMKFLKQGHIAYGLNENLASYRIVENSVSSNKFKNAKRYFWCLREKQNLSLIKSIYCQIGYMFNATKKRLI